MSGARHPFDPHNPSPEEDADMLAGYADAMAKRVDRKRRSDAYSHGLRNGTQDRSRTIDLGRQDAARMFLGYQGE